MKNAYQTSNSKKQATALKYDAKTSKSAPTVMAKGNGDLAQEIITLAKSHGIFIHEDEQLSNILSHLDLGQAVPETLYTVIAELISFSYVLQGKFPAEWENTHQRIDFLE
ncbi:EscU/YscU/HrcU family type III secretion system export apparatus switch protein [Agaribacter flavus]|uniref:Flagellar biosynthetic protein FlhB n=1 Tax=Agaribacter flavus TaxID=1902781 RepID=A0ABV7FTD9_9ALTE